MKVIYIIIITTLTLAFTANSAKGQKPSDSVKVIYKNKTVVVRAQGEESSSTVRFNDTANSRRVLVKVYFNEDEPGDDSDEDAIDTASKKFYKFIKDEVNKKGRKHFIETSFLPTIDIGLTSTLNESETPRTFTPRLGKSVNLDLGLVRQNMNLYNDQLLFSYGLNYNCYFLKYENKQVVQYLDNNAFISGAVDSANRYNKNRLDISYLAVPLLLEYHTKNDRFNIAAGVEFGFNARSKYVLKGENSESKYFKHKNDVNLKVSPTQMNAILKVGINNVALFAKYAITPMYKSSAYEPGADPGQHLYTVGICFFGI